jgi:hypothetical protein
MEDSPNSIYTIAARIKNLARDWDGVLTPIGEALCNTFALMVKDLYDFAEKLDEPNKSKLTELIRAKEDLPARIISLNRKKKST